MRVKGLGFRGVRFVEGVVQQLQLPSRLLDQLFVTYPSDLLLPCIAMYSTITAIT